MEDTNYLSEIHIVKGLDLSRFKLETIDEQNFHGLVDLVKINFAWNNISKLNSNTFIKCLKVEELNFSDNKIALIDDYAFKGLERLMKLTLRCNQLTQLNEKFFKELTYLRELDLYNNKISTIEPNTFSSLVNLIKLDLGMNCLEDSNGLVSLISIKELNISCNKINITIRNQFLKEKVNLVYLNLRYNYFPNMTAYIFNELTLLEELNVSFCKIKKIYNRTFIGLSKLSKYF
jgi:hypothetical protein